MGSKTNNYKKILPDTEDINFAKRVCFSDYIGMAPESTFPIDIEALLEVVYDVDIIPINGLERFYSADAILAADFKTIYVDKEQYMNPKFYRRVRFSLAHELGHIKLHKQLLLNRVGVVDIQGIKQFNMINLNNSLYRLIENQAHELAGGLLVPANNLIYEAAVLVRDNLDILYDNSLTVDQLLKGMSAKLAKTYNVSDGVIDVRIDRERLAVQLYLDPFSPLKQLSKITLSENLQRVIVNLQNLELAR